MIGVFFLVIIVLKPALVLAQNNGLFAQIEGLQLNQPFPPPLISSAESVDKRGQKQTYYYLSGNFVYPHFVDLESGQVVHTAVYIDQAHLAEYTQKLEQAGKPEIILQNTENERVLGFPSKGWVFVVNAQKRPVVFEKMKPRSERNMVAEYDSDTVLAAADELDKTTAEQELFLKYPNEVVKFAVQFYTAVLANPKLAIVALGVIVAVVLVVQAVLAVRNTIRTQRNEEIARLMQETVQINRQRETAAAVAETIAVPTYGHQDATGTGSAPVFDVSSVEAVSEDQMLAMAEADEESAFATYSAEAQAATSAAAEAYGMPDAEVLKQQAKHNPKLNQDLSKEEVELESESVSRSEMSETPKTAGH